MNLIEQRYKCFLLSLVCILIGLGTMLWNANNGEGMLNYDVEFTGGTSMTFDMGEVVAQEELAELIESVTGQKTIQIQSILGTNEVSIKLASLESESRDALAAEISAQYADAWLKSSSDVSATVSTEMQQAAVLATLIACGAMLLYISLRFRDIRAGGSAILTLCHDVLFVLGAYAILRIPVNNTFIAVLLTVLGYSINATIVIFDRVRENKANLEVAEEMKVTMDRSIKQTMARSIHTSVTTLLAVGAIYFFGVQSIKEFALPMMVGIVVGAYSSICIASSFWYTMLPRAEKEGIVAEPIEEDEA